MNSLNALRQLNLTSHVSCRYGTRAYSAPRQEVKVYRSSTTDPLFNLATEEWLFREGDLTKQNLFLWRNAPTVVIGRHQNPWKECHIKLMEKNGVVLSRRSSGGGAVYHDLGNTNFTFLSNMKSYSKKNNTDIIINSLKHFGITAEASGRNDVLVNGAKISGSAYKLSGERAFHHGTLLINLDMGALAQYLNVNKMKLQSKGVDSVRSRVANLTEFNPAITHESLSQAVIQEFFKFYGNECPIEDLDFNELKTKTRLQEAFDQQKDWGWRYGETPDFNHHMENRFEWGLVDVHVESKNGTIIDAKIFSDSLYPTMIDEVQKCLISAKYDHEGVSNALNKAKAALESRPETQAIGSHVEQLKNWLLETI